MIPLLLDMGLPRSAVGHLRRAGWIIEHVADIGLRAAPDVQILDEAERRGATIVTLDLDFARLLALSGRVRPSLILLRMQNVDGRLLEAWIPSVVPTIEPDLRSGCIATVDPGGVRIHGLPVRRGDSSR